MEKNNYYLELDIKFEEKEEKEIVEILHILNDLLKSKEGKNFRYKIKENPVYDSFGNL